MATAKPTSVMRGLTRRFECPVTIIHPEGFRYEWAIQQQWSDGSWRDVPKFNAWELSVDDKDKQP